jgi:integrase
MALAKWPVSPVWSEWIEAWSTALRAADRSRATIDSRRQVLAQLSREVAGDPGDLTPAQLLEWMGLEVWDEDLQRLRPRWSRERRRAVRSSLAGFYRWAHGAGRVADDPAAGLPVIRSSRGMPRPAALATYSAALGRAGAREQLMLVLACELGMRRAEVAQVHSRDVVDDLVGQSLIVHGKGARPRSIPIDDDLAEQLRDARGYVFPGRCDGHLSPRWVGKVVGRLLEGTTTMHQLRHAFATRMLREDTNIRVVQRWLGHASLAVTQVYLDVDDDEMRAAGAKVHAYFSPHRPPSPTNP